MSAVIIPEGVALAAIALRAARQEAKAARAAAGITDSHPTIPKPERRPTETKREYFRRTAGISGGAADLSTPELRRAHEATVAAADARAAFDRAVERWV